MAKGESKGLFLRKIPYGILKKIKKERHCPAFVSWFGRWVHLPVGFNG